LQQALAPRYLVEEEVATGGMAVVFRAVDTSLDRTVAVKVLLPQLATARGAERFLRETEIAAGLNHPHILPLFESGEADDLLYYVMPFIEGESVRDRLKREPQLPIEDSFRIAREVASALEYAHERGVIHRDIKPENVLLSAGEAVVADFGIAKAIDTAGGERLTATGLVLGTPAYMSPEQGSGESEPDARSDIYSLGCVLYEMLAGNPPFTGPTPQAILRRKSSEAVPSLKLIREGISHRIDATVRKALARDPADRYQNARDFAAALQASVAERKRRRATPALVAAFFLALIAIGLGMLVARSRSGPPLLDLAVFPCEAEIGTNPEDARNLAWAVATNLDYIPGIRLVDPNTSFSLYDARGGHVSPEEWTSRLNAGQATRCRLRRAGQQDVVDLSIINADGRSRSVQIHAAGLKSPLPAADSVTFEILRHMDVPAVSREAVSHLSGYDLFAVNSFLQGEEDYRRYALSVAAGHYRDALAIDSSLAVARWRLAEVRRWIPGTVIQVDLSELQRQGAGGLSRLDSLLLNARLLESGPEQYRAYEGILEEDAYRHEAYATLLYADEVYHRGGLWGIPLDSGVALIRLAVERDSFLVPAVDHLTQARIRQGDEAEAARLLKYLKRVSASPEEVGMPNVALWTQAYTERFHSEEAEAALDHLLELVPDPVEILQLAARGVRYVDLPQAQVRLGGRLVEIAGGDALHASAGHLAQGIGQIWQGRIRDGYAHFDSITARTAGQPEATLQAAEWRVVPHALGLEGFPGVAARAGAQTGAQTLAMLYADTLTPAPLRARAAWALALSALAAGDTVAWSQWTDSLQSLPAEADAGRLERLLAASGLAAEGRYEEALERTEDDYLSYDAEDRGARPFARSALHLKRGEWFERLAEVRPGRLAAEANLARAVGSWLWYENTDVAVAGPHLVQATEVDAALGVHARVRLVRAARRLSTPPIDLICRWAADVVRLWPDPDEDLEPLAREMRETALMNDCPL
jgi:hypothetical protein